MKSKFAAFRAAVCVVVCLVPSLAHAQEGYERIGDPNEQEKISSPATPDSNPPCNPPAVETPQVQLKFYPQAAPVAEAGTVIHKHYYSGGSGSRTYGAFQREYRSELSRFSKEIREWIAQEFARNHKWMNEEFYYLKHHIHGDRAIQTRYMEWVKKELAKPQPAATLIPTDAPSNNSFASADNRAVIKVLLGMLLLALLGAIIMRARERE